MWSEDTRPGAAVSTQGPGSDGGHPAGDDEDALPAGEAEHPACDTGVGTPPGSRPKSDSGVGTPPGSPPKSASAGMKMA